MNSDASYTSSGYLMTKASGRLKLWQRRYVVLDATSLTLYKSRVEVGGAPIKQLLLADIESVLAPGKPGKKNAPVVRLSDFDFAVILRENTHVITLRAANIEEQRTWLNTMQTFVADGNLSDPPSPKSANKIELINNDKLDIEEKYAFGKMLGSGVAGEVHLATHRQTGQKVAIKTLSKQKFIVNARSKTTTAREIDIMQRLTNLDPSSDHLVDLYAVIETASNVHIVMELVEGGELFERVCDKGVYTEDEARRVMTGLIDALEVLHSQGIVHRDIKPENILLTKENDTKIKLTDFGLSNIMGADDVLKSKCGTPVYMAPEMLQRKPYNTAVDVWSVGIILYIIVSGTLPFYADNPDDFLDLVLESEYSFPEEEWGDLSSSIQELIRQILVPNPRDRLTLDDIRASPWMTKSSQKR